MCGFDPVTMFAISTIATGAMQAVGSISQGNAAAQAGEATRASYYRQAELDRIAAGYEGVKEFEKGRRVQSAALVQVAGSGVTLEGSPTELLAENARQNQMDIEAIQFGSQIRQDNMRVQGDLAKMQGDQRRTAGYIGAATAAAGTMASLYTPRASAKFGGSGFSS